MSNIGGLSKTAENYKITEVPENHKKVLDRHLVPGGFVGHEEIDSPWVPFGDNAAIRHLAFDVRQNWYGNILWIKSPGIIGTHKHRGQVIMLCLEGSVRYLEYDWVAKPGDFISEAPGQAHTLVTDHPEGVKIFGWMQGANEFYDDDGKFIETLDVWWFINHYETYCKENNLSINKELYR